MPSVCIWGSGHRLCTYFGPQWPCSEGYCWGEESSIPPNAGISANAVLSDKTIEINGVYQITQNVTFLNCNFKMRPGASIMITPTAANAEITFKGCKFFGCGSMWLGITIDASGASFLDFTFDSCWVEDAYIALTLDEGKPYQYAVFNTKFINNYIGISNRKQTGGAGSMINAVLAGNLFTSTYSLSAIPGSMQNLPMPFHPLAYAGVNYVKAHAMIGTFSSDPNNNTTNYFFCLVYGIVADNCSISAKNNDFQDLNSGYGRGIWAFGGSMRAVGCHFRNAGQYCIYADGADLTALENRFEGISETGILSVNNLNSEFILIEDNNTFNISNDKWRSGIEIQRSVALAGVHNVIRNNTFNVSGTAQLLSCIQISGVFGPATDEIVPYVAPCDRHQFKDTDESSERSNETHNVTAATSEMLRIAPNPTNGLTKVSVPKGFVGLLTLMDASGKKIRTLSIEEGENMLGLDLSHQIPGLYWIALSDTSGFIVASAKISLIH